jgi:magnesium chelatase family protein
MALARAHSVALIGVDGHVVEIEADVGGGLPGFHLVGLPDAALHESKDRVRAAVVNSACRQQALIQLYRDGRNFTFHLVA